MWASNSAATFFVSEVLAVPQPVSVRILTSCPVVAFGSIPALLHHSLARRLPFLIISIAMPEQEAENELLGDESRLKNKKQKQKFLGRVLYRKVSVRCTISAECQAYEVKLMLLQFLGFSVAHGRMYDVEQRVNLKRYINKGKAIGSTLKISH